MPKASKLATALLADPVAGPWRRKHIDRDCPKPVALERLDDVGLDDSCRRATGVGRRHADFNRAIGAFAQMPDDTEVKDAQDRDLGVRDPGEQLAQSRITAGGGAASIEAGAAIIGGLPGRARMSAVQGLHLGQHMAEVLAVLPSLAMPAEWRHGRFGKAGVGKDRADTR